MPVTLHRFYLLPAIAAAALLGGCANAPPAAPPPSGESRGEWQAPLPHSGEFTAMNRWWQQFNDPLLVQLVAAAQAVSPSVASAAFRIEQARATRVATCRTSSAA